MEDGDVDLGVAADLAAVGDCVSTAPRIDERCHTWFGTREKICSLVIPGEAIATPCAVHRTPIERGDEQRRQLTISRKVRLSLTPVQVRPLS